MNRRVGEIIKILLIDDAKADHIVVCKILAPMLDNGIGQLQCVLTLAEGLRTITEWQPDITLLDLTFPKTDTDPGSTAEQTIESILPRMAPLTCTVILTGHEQETGIWSRCIQAGAMNFLQKQYYFDVERKKAFWHAMITSMWLFPLRKWS